MFQQIGGVKIGRDLLRCWNVGWPFARIVVGAQSLEIRVFLFGVTKKYAFARDEIFGLRVVKVTFSRILVVEHRNEKYANFIAWESFPSRGFSALLDELQRQQYDVATD